VPPAERAETIDPADFDRERLATAIFFETNRVRESLGLRRLRAFPRLQNAAQLQSTMNALRGTAVHDNPLRGRRDVHARIAYENIRAGAAAENVLFGPIRTGPPGTRIYAKRDETGRWERFDGATHEPLAWPSYGELAERLVQGWLDSPSHRVNLLSPEFSHLACAVMIAPVLNGAVNVYATQVFLRPRRRE